MKTAEMMIGDWFIYFKNPTRWCISDFCNSDAYVTEHYSPIPLTPEILKKNGFKDAPTKDTDAYNLVGKWWHKSGDVYVKKYCLSHGAYAYTIGFHPYTRIENIHNVHELQHALRLCGLDDLADNFKI